MDQEAESPIVRGGTYFCCRLDKTVEVPKLDKRGRKTRYKTIITKPCKRRVPLSQPGIIARHLRRQHGYV